MFHENGSNSEEKRSVCISLLGTGPSYETFGGIYFIYSSNQILLSVVGDSSRGFAHVGYKSWLESKGVARSSDQGERKRWGGSWTGRGKLNQYIFENN